MNIFIIKIILSLVLSLIPQESLIYYSDEYKFEDFIITEINEDYFRGELLFGEGEGVYIDCTYYKNFNDIMYDLEIGDIIKVKYYASDYQEEIWDNIQYIQILNK